ncbi:haloacid dehalogenase-like hydrolase, partial [Salmonella enterica subsp. enterica serovar Vitkin]|nr:haloacid dehalogenase-like hydrolase [Salmonella enterica subsp. enterica serovar Vitkin]
KNEKVFIKNGIEFINYDKLINMIKMDDYERV